MGDPQLNSLPLCRSFLIFIGCIKVRINIKIKIIPQRNHKYERDQQSNCAFKTVSTRLFIDLKDFIDVRKAAIINDELLKLDVDIVI